ncbi:MAG TPA: hypothetical protein VMS30_07700 [Phycisphaerales bacterium]|nr:hypothetical protein [Phycisphaerales bacterium]
MKRWAVRICVFLLLGAIVNVAVAWVPLPSWLVNSSKPSLARTDTWVVQRFTNDPNRTIWAFRYMPATVIFPPEYQVQPVEDVLAPYGEECLTHIRRLHDEESYLLMGWGGAQGFPMLALRGFAIETRKPSYEGSQRVDLETFGLLVSKRVRFGEARPYPLIPIWPGFAINTVFYALVLWLLFAAPFALRRWRRIKRGLCPKCAYPVGTNEVCTECGHPIKTA